MRTAKRERAKYRNRKVYRTPAGAVFYTKRAGDGTAYVYFTPAGERPGPAYDGPKVKVADSVKEWRRFLFLLGELRAGRIQALRMQVAYPLHGPNGTRIATYVADFVYVLAGRLIVEDVKSPVTRRLRVYKIKRKWMQDEYGITVHEA